MVATLIVILVVLAASLLLLLWLAESLASKLASTREVLKETEDRLENETKEKERLDRMLSTWMKAHDLKEDRIRELRDALKSLSELAGESAKI